MFVFQYQVLARTLAIDGVLPHPAKGKGMTETTQTDYLTRAEAAARCRVPLPTFDKLRRDGLIPEPDAEVGKHKLWRSDTIEEFLEVGGTRR